MNYIKCTVDRSTIYKAWQRTPASHPRQTEQPWHGHAAFPIDLSRYRKVRETISPKFSMFGLFESNFPCHVIFFGFGLGGHRPLDNPKPQQRRPCCPKGKYCPLQRLDRRDAHTHTHTETKCTKLNGHAWDARRANGSIWSLATKFSCLVQMPWSSSQRWAVHPDMVATLGVLSTWCQRRGTEWIRGTVCPQTHTWRVGLIFAFPEWPEWPSRMQSCCILILKYILSYRYHEMVFYYMHIYERFT